MCYPYQATTTGAQDMAELDLDKLKPKTVDVFLGDKIKFTMREPSIAQAREVLAVASGVELERVVDPFVKLLRGDDGALALTSDAGALLGRVQAIGPELLEAARPVLGSQFAPAVMGAAIACLDSRRFRKALIAADVFKDEDAPVNVDDDGGYDGCPAVRAWLREDMTIRQAVHVLTSALGMIDLVGSVGNLFGALMPEAEEAEAPTTSTPARPARKRRK